MTTDQRHDVRLRAVNDDDLEALFELESDVAGSDMIAFLPRHPGDRAAFDAHWARIRADPDTLTWVIEADGGFAGYALSFLMNGERQVGYWIVRELWGRGIASAALRAVLGEVNERPLWGSTVSDNLGSQRVLQNAGFAFDRIERSHAPRRDAEVDEHVFRLD
ncbi:MAG: GNAT family N-acetyltransferase [Pseudolysinimonas sp.]